METVVSKTVSEIAAERPASLRVFEALGVDYCCGGKKSLQSVCEDLQITTDEVLVRIEQAEAAAVEESDPGWLTQPLTALCEHIVRRHHTFVRDELVRLRRIADKVLSVHGAAHPELHRLREVFAVLDSEMTAHMLKEEQALFPHIERMEHAVQSGQPLPPAFFGSAANPITAMMDEHESAGSLLAELRAVTRSYQLPEGACATYRALYSGLQDFERDLHRHVHLENNILFPRVLRLEKEQAVPR